MRKIFRVLSVVLVITLLVGIVPGNAYSAYANGAYQNGSAGEIFNVIQNSGVVTTSPSALAVTSTSVGYGSNGKFIAPIEPPVEGSIPISSRAELEFINNDLSGNYHLTNDIDLSGAEWVPIGYNDSPFMGVFDGQGYTINNMYILESSSMSIAGLFWGVSGYESIIKNVGVSIGSLEVFATDAAGGLAGFINYQGTVANSYTNGNVSANACAGGLIGQISDFGGTITNSYATGNVNAIFSDYFAEAGGLVGTVLSQGTVTNCYATGDVTASSIFNGDVYSGAGNVFAGGLVGRFNTSQGIISNSYAIGNVSASNGYGVWAGGLVGDGRAVTDSYATGNVSTSGYAMTFYAGGLMGGGDYATITNSYSLGNISTPIDSDSGYYFFAGGLSGLARESIIANSYRLSTQTIIGTTIDENGIPLTPSQMRSGDNFDNWDFENVWDISSTVNNGFPFLRNIPVEVGIGEEPVDPEQDISFTFKYQSGFGGDYPEVEGRYTYSNTYFNESATLYNHDLATTSLCLAMATYKWNELETLFGNIGFDEPQASEYYKTGSTSHNGIAVGLANKKGVTASDGNTYTVVAVAIRGFNYGNEWASNFSVGNNPAFHEGFLLASEQVESEIMDYINPLFANGENIKLWITGYSRAGAVANLLSGRLSIYNADLFINGKEDIYTYTFEAPRGVQRSEVGGLSLHNIKNIIHTNDVVPKVAPAQWGYARYGVDLYFPALDTSHDFTTQFDNMYEVYSQQTGIHRININNLKYFSYPRQIWTELGSFYTIYDEPLSIFTDRLLSKVSRSISEDVYKEAGNPPLQTILVSHWIANPNAGLDNMITGTELMLLLGNALETPSYWGLVDAIPEVINFYSATDKGSLLYTHYPEVIFSWMLSLNGMIGTEWFNDGSSRVVIVNCPVDVEVQDSNGVLVASILNDEPQEIGNSYIHAEVDIDGQKVIYLPTNETYTVNISATDAGYMSYSVHEYSRENESVTRVVNYYDIPIVQGNSFTATVESLSNAGNATYPLTDDSGNIIPFSEDASNDDIDEYMINITASGEGDVIGEGFRIKGTYAKVTAIPQAGSVFSGWYIGDAKIADEAEYRFRVLGDTTIEARFSQMAAQTYTVTATAGTGGSVSGGGTFEANATVTLNATPNNGYTFEGWYESGSKITGTESSYSFPATSNRTIEARFTKTTNITTYTITATAGTGGSASGGGTFNANTMVALTASPGANYIFEGWYENGYIINGANAYYTFTATVNRQLEARFIYIGSLGNNEGSGSGYSSDSVISSTSAQPRYEFQNSNGADNTPSTRRQFNSDISGFTNPYVDVSAEDWFYNPVAYTYLNGLMTGTNTNPMTFSPNMTVTRGMVVTVLHRIEGKSDVTGLANPFDDVAEDKYYANAVKWAASNRIVSGYGNGKYGPDDDITREQLATMLNNYAEYAGMSLPVTRNYTSFNDEADIANYAKESIERFFKAGVVNGKPGNFFDPKGSATRAELATMLMNFLEAVK